jgi:hypothetical protein
MQKKQFLFFLPNISHIFPYFIAEDNSLLKSLTNIKKDKTMNTEPINIMAQSVIHIQPINISRIKESLSRWSLILIKTILEYGFGAHLGSAVGYITGLAIGHHYINVTNCSTFINIESFHCSIEFPFLLGICGAVIGLIPGMFWVAGVNRRLFSQRIRSMYEQGATVNKISRTLLKSENKIKRAIANLTEGDKASL